MTSRSNLLGASNIYPFSTQQAQATEKDFLFEWEETVNIRSSTAQDVALGVVLSHTHTILEDRGSGMPLQQSLESEQRSPFYPLPNSSRIYRNYDVAASSLCKLWRAMEWGSAFMQNQREIVQSSKSKSLCIRYNYSPWYRPKRRKTLSPSKPAELGEPGWLNTRYPFLGFAPVDLETLGFRNLLGPDPTLCSESVVIEAASGDFRTHEDIAQTWFFLEEQLSWLVTALTSITPSVPWARSTRYPSPSSFGYRRASDTREAQLEAIVASRDAFRAPIASIRALTSINRNTWRDKMVNDFDVPQPWLDFLHECGVVCPPNSGESGIGVVGCARNDFWDCVGAHTTIDNIVNHDLLKASIRYGMPVSIIWGEPDVLRHLSKDPELRKIWEEFHPRPSETTSLTLAETNLDNVFLNGRRLDTQKSTVPVQKTTELLRLPVKPAQECATLEFSSSEFALCDAGDIYDLYDTDTGPPDRIVPSAIDCEQPLHIPQPYPDSGQLRGESPREFITRRKQMLEKRILVEKMEDRQSRLARMEHAKKKIPPGTKGAAVFEWYDIGNGQFLRQRVPKVAVEGTWGNYSENAKIYDPLKDEWDLWEGFDTSGGLPEQLLREYYSGIGEDGKEVCEEEMQELVELVESRTDPSAIRQVHEAREFFRRHAEQIQQTALDSLPELDGDLAPMLGVDQDLVESTRQRFGLVQRREEVIHGGDISEKDFDKCLVKLYWTKPKTSLDSVIPTSLHRDLAALIAGLENNQGSIQNLPSDLFDLRDTNPNSLARNANAFIRIESRIVAAHVRREILEPASKRVKQVHKVYFVSAGDRCHRKPAWMLILSDPVAVLSCMRSKSHDFYEIVESLLRCGIPLHTVQSDQQAAKRSSRLCSSYLPIRLPSSRIRSAYYLQYVRRMKQLVLNNHRVGRAALMRGGIIWRLVIELVRLEDVLMGPSQERLGPIVHVIRRDGMGPEAWYDDELTREEEDVICGVFRSREEPTHESEQLWSFWPTPNVWETSSVNAGQWTPHNEEWFVKRRDFLAGIAPSRRDAESSIRLYYQKVWRMKLQGQKKLGLPVVRRNRELAEEYLDAVLRSPCVNA